MLGSLSMWTFLPKMLVKADWKSLVFRHHIHETLVYFIPTIAVSVSAVLDKFLLGLLIHNFSLSGYYEHARKLMALVDTVVFGALISVMEARVSYLFVQGKTDEIKRYIRRTVDFSFLIGIGCLFGIAGIAHVFVPVFWGPGWEPVETLLYLLCPNTLIISISYIVGALYYNPSGNRAQSARYVIIDACINTVLNLLLIPRWNAYGAVIATISAEGITTYIYVQNCRGYLTWQTIWACFWKRFLVGAAMCILVAGIGRSQIGGNLLKLAIQIASGAVFYPAALYLAKDEMLKETMNLLVSRIRRMFKMLPQ